MTIASSVRHPSRARVVNSQPETSPTGNIASVDITAAVPNGIT